MNRTLHFTPTYYRAARRLLKRHPELDARLEAILQLLAKDAFQPRLRCHKLKGRLTGKWACALAYDLRIVFELRPQDGQEVIVLLTIGTHDEVY